MLLDSNQLIYMPYVHGNPDGIIIEILQYEWRRLLERLEAHLKMSYMVCYDGHFFYHRERETPHWYFKILSSGNDETSYQVNLLTLLRDINDYLFRSRCRSIMFVSEEDQSYQVVVVVFGQKYNQLYTFDFNNNVHVHGNVARLCKELKVVKYNHQVTDYENQTMTMSASVRMIQWFLCKGSFLTPQMFSDDFVPYQ